MRFNHNFCFFPYKLKKNQIVLMNNKMNLEDFEVQKKNCNLMVCLCWKRFMLSFYHLYLSQFLIPEESSRYILEDKLHWIKHKLTRGFGSDLIGERFNDKSISWTSTRSIYLREARGQASFCCRVSWEKSPLSGQWQHVTALPSLCVTVWSGSSHLASLGLDF